MRSREDATALAASLVSGLLRSGVSQAVLAPGSRNAPLAFAAQQAAQDGRLDLHTRIDERTGAFLALGLAKSSRRPVPVITTSGTAAANLHPAMLEASHAGVGLVAVTADRPARLRGTLANQTTEQVGLFGTAAPAFDVADIADLGAAMTAVASPGPAHLNVQFEEPLVGVPELGAVPSSAEPVAPVPMTPEPESRPLPLGPRTVVVAGDDSGPAARRLAEKAGWPLLAEPSSGARTGSHAIRCYRLLLDGELGAEIQRVVVFGAPTLSRPVQRLLARPGVEVIAATARGRWSKRPHPVALEHDGAFAVERADEPGWLRRWREQDAVLAERLDQRIAAEGELTPYDVAAGVHAALPAGGLLVVGASNPIRDLDLMAGAYPVGERRMVLANRGLAGIDGTLSTAIGAALGRPHSTRALAYLGDVTFLHDLTALVIGPGERLPDVSIVVANDDGGSIFATLEQGDPRYGDSYEKLFGTPHGADLGALCAGLGIAHRRVGSRAGLAAALEAPAGGIEVVEAAVRRDNRRELDAAIRDLV